jgi:hypothetical protein
LPGTLARRASAFLATPPTLPSPTASSWGADRDWRRPTGQAPRRPQARWSGAALAPIASALVERGAVADRELLGAANAYR